MRFRIAAALALTAATSLHAQTVTTDFNTATPLPGTWVWARTPDGSEATFVDAYSHPQLWVRCTRSTRTVTIARPASAAAPTLDVWTSAQTRKLPASFDPATARLSAHLTAFDRLLDALATSRGRIAVAVAGATPLVAPAWADVARVVEDCRV